MRRSPAPQRTPRTADLSTRDEACADPKRESSGPSSFGRSLSFHPSQHPGGITRYDRIRRHVFGHHTACSDHSAFAYRHARKNRRARPDRGALTDQGLLHTPVRFRLEAAIVVGRAWVGIVDECDPVTDKHVIVNGHSLAHERVTGDFAVLADFCIPLHFHKCANLSVVANLAAVEIDESAQSHTRAELHVGSNMQIRVHTITAFPRLLSDFSAASSIFTTRRPAKPSLNGVTPFSTQSRKYLISSDNASAASTLG